jgi:ribosome-associated protein
VLDIGAGEQLPEGELSFRYTRSGGPGGQHVNTSSTRVELTFDLEGSATLTAAEKSRARRRLRSRLDSEGKLRIVASDERSQGRNRALATERFVDAMRTALAPPPPPRRPTKPTRSSSEARLRAKKRGSTRKRERQPPSGDDG